MKEQSTYQQALRDPRWQKKRLEILEKAKFTCESCGESKKELHVHHLIYRRGKLPWEYEDPDLFCLCSSCHEAFGQSKETLENTIISYIHCMTCEHQFDVYTMLFSFLTGLMGPSPTDKKYGKDMDTLTPGERKGYLAADFIKLHEDYAEDKDE